MRRERGIGADGGARMQGWLSRWAVSLALGGALIALPGCRRESPPPPQRNPTAEPRGGYVLHEWGLFGGVANSQALEIATSPHPTLAVGAAQAGAEPAPPGLGLEGTGIGGGKPVIYVHLDPGVETLTFDLVSQLANGRFEERFPGGRDPGTTLRFDDVRVTRGACGTPTPTPTSAEDPACRTSDGFCEAIEIPRYVGEGDTCLHVGAQESPLLFYRAAGLTGVALPLGLTIDVDGNLRYAQGPGHEAVTTVYRIRKRHGRHERERLPPRTVTGEFGFIPGTPLDAPALRAELVGEAVQRGLTRREAEVFVDAWGPVLGFAEEPREGPQAAGTAPLSLGAAKDAIVYFAPPALVEALLPMDVDPAPRAFARVFLVRVVDPRRPTDEELDPLDVGLGPLSHPPNAGVPLTDIRVQDPVRVRGPLSPEGIARIARRRIYEPMWCYWEALKTAPRLRGTLTMEVSISPTGAVSSARIGGGSLRDEGMRACVRDMVGRWIFRVAEPPQATEAEFGLEFSVQRPWGKR